MECVGVGGWLCLLRLLPQDPPLLFLCVCVVVVVVEASSMPAIIIQQTPTHIHKTHTHTTTGTFFSTFLRTSTSGWVTFWVLGCVGPWHPSPLGSIPSAYHHLTNIRHTHTHTYTHTHSIKTPCLAREASSGKAQMTTPVRQKQRRKWT